ncbi:MAG TPA: sulfatase [Tepidisphaeraceae bacterium]|jgi:arylsulfatase A-like enzyme
MRRFIFALAVFIGSLAWGGERPNFLLVITDDQRWDAVGVVAKEMGEKARFSWFQTPAMDRLAREGLRFRNAFVVNSLCAPSRANFLTGAYSHNNGVTNNHTPFPASNVTHATELRKAGYITGYFGKWHHGQQKERPGFDVVRSFVGQGKYEDCPFNIDGEIHPTKGWVDDVTTDFAIDFLKARAGDRKNFDMVVGFKSPHDPRHPPERAKERFKDAAPKPVPNLESSPPYRAGRATTKMRAGRGGEGFINYFRCISAIDDDLGRLLDALDELKLAENTVVVFTSDNGYLFGEHSLGDKRAAYEESMRIPLIIRYPKLIKAGTTSDEMALNIDYAPTILELAGAKVPGVMQGKSWAALLAKGDVRLRDSFFYEYFFEKGYQTPTVTAVRTAGAKLVRYPGHEEWTELFDLKADPFETKNLAQDAGAEGVKREMAEVYERLTHEMGFRIPEVADKPISASEHE